MCCQSCYVENLRISYQSFAYSFVTVLALIFNSEAICSFVLFSNNIRNICCSCASYSCFAIAISIIPYPPPGYYIFSVKTCNITKHFTTMFIKNTIIILEFRIVIIIILLIVNYYIFFFNLLLYRFGDFSCLILLLIQKFLIFKFLFI